jgi:hypothetical protein
MSRSYTTSPPWRLHGIADSFTLLFLSIKRHKSPYRLNYLKQEMILLWKKIVLFNSTTSKSCITLKKALEATGIFAVFSIGRVEIFREKKFKSFFPPEGGVGLVSKRGCLLTLAYYAFPIWYEFGERMWNDTDRENPKNSEKNLSQCQFVHHKSQIDWTGRETGPPLWEAGD